MPLVFPTLSSGFVSKYPLKRTHKHRSTVYVHGDFTEQRFAKGVQLEEFELHFTAVPTLDKENIRTFFSETRGQFDTTWSLNIVDVDGITVSYNYMQFVDSAFHAVENDEGFWTFTLKMRQTRKN